MGKPTYIPSLRVDALEVAGKPYAEAVPAVLEAAEPPIIVADDVKSVKALLEALAEGGLINLATEVEPEE